MKIPFIIRNRKIIVCVVLLIAVISCVKKSTDSSTDAYVDCILVAVNDNIEGVLKGDEKRRVVFDFVMINHNEHDVFVPIGWKGINHYLSKMSICALDGKRVVLDNNGNTSYNSKLKPKTSNHIRAVLASSDIERLGFGEKDATKKILNQTHFEYIPDLEDKKETNKEIGRILFLRKDSIQYIIGTSCHNK